MSNKRGNGFAKFIAGVGIGAGLGLLFAPKSGEETRKTLMKKINQFIEEIKKIDVNDVKDEFLTRIEDIRSELEDLDKEKVLKIAKDKSEDIKNKTTEETLIKLGGKRQVPFLVDNDRNIQMYESNDIIESLKTII